MTPREIIKEYQKINAAQAKDIAAQAQKIAEYERRYGALNGAKLTCITKVRATRAKVTV